MRDIVICRKCEHFLEGSGIMICVDDNTVKLCQEGEGVQRLKCNIASGVDEYQALELLDCCKMYTEQFISNCCHEK